jgi:hypothetical protein
MAAIFLFHATLEEKNLERGAFKLLYHCRESVFLFALATLDSLDSKII